MDFLQIIKEECKNLNKQDNHDISIKKKKKIDEACFQHDMVYGGFKDLTRKTASDKILRDK